jgi:Aerotolerance regulator N-terminal/von Willebrand factor type A domain
MSFLAPLYALAGLAIAIPILFHLIRSRPKERKLISSLMFLEQTPPKLTRPSSVDKWLLLLLRAIAIGLLAFAFTRPYWNAPAEKDTDKVGVQRMLLVDTSASMRREGVWEAAVQRAEQVIRQSGPTDAISVYQFDATMRPLIAIDSALQTPAAQRQAQALAGLKNLAPTWMHTDLGLSLLTAADLLQTDWDGASDSNATMSEIVVVTDFQNGAQVERLAEYTWPSSCKVRIERIEAKMKGNASLTLLSPEELLNKDSSTRGDKFAGSSASTLPSDVDKLRVRVSNTAGSPNETFRLHWLDGELRPIEESRTSCRVPAGSSLTVRMAVPPKGAVAIELDGDGSDFDNRYFFCRTEPLQTALLCVESAGRAPDESLGYFLAQLPLSDTTRTVSFQQRRPASNAPWPSASETPLIVASHELVASDMDALVNYMNQGGSLLWVCDQAAASNDVEGLSKPVDYSLGMQKLAGLTDADVTEAKVRQYAMLESVDFKHPLFADLADSKFNDFSKLRFWKHRRIKSQASDDWRILAKFDDGSPALICKNRGAGKLWILLSGWQPLESQLALSTKFVPLISGLYRISSPMMNDDVSYRVGATLTVSSDQKILDPSGVEVSTHESAAKNAEKIDAKDDGKIVKTAALTEPGVFRRQNANGAETWLAVNTMESESNTSIGGLERLEKLGVVLSDSKPPKSDESTRRQLRAVELESQQGWWRWMIFGVVGVIGVESLLCIRKAG